MKHTPTPWKAGEAFSGHRAIYDRKGNLIVRFGEGQDEEWKEPKNARANSKFIVRAVNSHEAYERVREEMQLRFIAGCGADPHELCVWLKAIAQAESK
jgi:hypothetical protein